MKPSTVPTLDGIYFLFLYKFVKNNRTKKEIKYEYNYKVVINMNKLFDVYEGEY